MVHFHSFGVRRYPLMLSGLGFVAVLTYLRVQSMNPLKAAAVNPASSAAAQQDDDTSGSGAFGEGAPGESVTVAIVSASYGGRGWLRELPEPPPGVKCVLYTDEQLEEELFHGWTVSNFPYHAHVQEMWPDLYAYGRHSWGNASGDSYYANLMSAKFYKMNMHVLPEMRGIDLAFWIDADALCDWENSTLLSTVIPATLAGNHIAVENHLGRHSQHQEMWKAAEQVLRRRGVAVPHVEVHLRKWRWMPPYFAQQAHQEAEGFRDDIGLFQASWFIVNISSPEVHEALKTWWYEVQVHTPRDQLSLPYVVWKHKLRVARLEPNALGNLLHEGSIWSNRTLQVGSHRYTMDVIRSMTRRDLYLEALANASREKKEQQDEQQAGTAPR